MRKPTKTTQRAKCDRIFSAQVRARGRCQAATYTPVTCNGNLQTMHVVSRRYLSVRWSHDNALCGCAAHHTFFTNHPLEFEEFVTWFLGESEFQALKRRARLARGAPDYDEVLAYLEGYEHEHELASERSAGLG